MARHLFHLGGIAFLAWVVLAAAKWAFVGGVAGFALHAWSTRPGGEERARQAEQVRRERPFPPDERVRDAVQGASTVELRLVERRWLRAAVEARNPTASVVEVRGVMCRVLFTPDGGQQPDVEHRGPWRIRLEPGEGYRGEVRMRDPDAASAAPLGLAEHRCRLDLRAMPPPAAPPGAPSNPIRMSPNGYRS